MSTERSEAVKAFEELTGQLALGYAAPVLGREKVVVRIRGGELHLTKVQKDVKLLLRTGGEG